MKVFYLQIQLNQCYTILAECYIIVMTAKTAKKLLWKRFQVPKTMRLIVFCRLSEQFSTSFPDRCVVVIGFQENAATTIMRRLSWEEWPYQKESWREWPSNFLSRFWNSFWAKYESMEFLKFSNGFWSVFFFVWDSSNFSGLEILNLSLPLPEGGGQNKYQIQNVSLPLPEGGGQNKY